MWVSCESCQFCSLSSSWSIGIYSQLIGFSLQWWIVPRVFFVWLQTTKSDEIWWNDLQLCRWDQFRGRPNEQRWAMRKSCVCFFWILHSKEVHEKTKNNKVPAFCASVSRAQAKATPSDVARTERCFDVFRSPSALGWMCFAFLHLAKAEGVRRPPRPGKPLRAKVAQENTLFSKSKQHKDWKNV